MPVRVLVAEVEVLDGADVEVGAAVVVVPPEVS